MLGHISANIRPLRVRVLAYSREMQIHPHVQNLPISAEAFISLFDALSAELEYRECDHTLEKSMPSSSGGVAVIDIEQLTKLITQIVRAELAAARPAEAENITAAAYAAKHSIGVSTVRQAIAEKRLPCIKIGRLVRVPSTATISPKQTDTQTRKDRVLKLVGGGVTVSRSSAGAEGGSKGR